MRVGRSALMVAILGVTFLFLLGLAFVTTVGVSLIEAIFVGAALVATSVGITAQVLAAKGLLQERASRVILAAAVIDDVLGLLVLATVTNLARDQIHVLGLITTAIMAAMFTILVATFGTRAVGRVIPRVENRLSVK